MGIIKTSCPSAFDFKWLTSFYGCVLKKGGNVEVNQQL
jgi:hypothetical protein